MRLLSGITAVIAVASCASPQVTGQVYVYNESAQSVFLQIQPQESTNGRTVALESETGGLLGTVFGDVVTAVVYSSDCRFLNTAPIITLTETLIIVDAGGFPMNSIIDSEYGRTAKARGRLPEQRDCRTGPVSPPATTFNNHFLGMMGASVKIRASVWRSSFGGRFREVGGKTVHEGPGQP